MELIIFDTYEELSIKTAEVIAAVILKKPDALLCFPAGETSIGTFNHLISLNEIGKISFSQCKIVGLDEWLNLGEMKSQNCYSFLRNHLFDMIDYSEENLCFFDSETKNPDGECQKADEFIKKWGPIDMILLGIGMNGHVGLNEPGTSPDLYAHTVRLDRTTKSVGKKYFEDEVNLSEGITLGLKHILESNHLLLQISGAGKASIAKQLIHSDPSPDLPASMIKSHQNSYLLLDKEAAALI